MPVAASAPADPARPCLVDGAHTGAAAAAPSRSRRQYMWASGRGSPSRRAVAASRRLSDGGQRPIRGREPAARAYPHDPTTHPAPDPGRLAGRRNGPRPVQPARPRHRRNLPGRVRLRLVAARADHRHRQRRRSASRRTLIDFETDLGIEKQRVREFRRRPAAGPEAQVQARLPADQLQGRRPRPAADDRLQRPVLRRRAAGQRRRRLHDPEDRLRVRLHLQGPRLPRLRPRHQGDAGADRLRQPDQRRVRRGHRADPDARLRRPRPTPRATSPSAAR